MRPPFRSSTPSPPALKPFEREISRCVKCGACRAVCPTFLLTREESLSARGRMALIKKVLNGQLPVTKAYKDRLSTCTGCLACEASCPSGVRVTEIIQAAKEHAVTDSAWGIINTALAGVIKNPALFRATAPLAPVLLHYSGGRWAGDRGQPAQSAEHGVNEVRKNNGTKGRIAFFPGCAVQHFHRDIGAAVVSVLGRLGYDVIIPEGLNCCGRPLLSLGDRQSAREVAARNASVLAELKVDAIVTACASCGLTFQHEYPKLLPFGAKNPTVLDIHEFLASRLAGITLHPVHKTITWHDPCHLGRGQGLGRTAREILNAIPGLTFVEMKNADRCCGFGGVMRISHRRLSDGIVADKVNSIIESGASTVATGCPGCRMQISDAIGRRGLDIEVEHTVQLLEQALGNAVFGARSEELEMTGHGAMGPRSGK